MIPSSDQVIQLEKKALMYVPVECLETPRDLGLVVHGFV